MSREVYPKAVEKSGWCSRRRNIWTAFLWTSIEPSFVSCRLKSTRHQSPNDETEGLSGTGAGGSETLPRTAYCLAGQGAHRGNVPQEEGWAWAALAGVLSQDSDRRRQNAFGGKNHRSGTKHLP